MFTNQELLNKKNFQKALNMMQTITLAPQEADRFIDYVYDQSVLKNNARQVKMTKASVNIRAIGLGTGRILHPGKTFSSSDYKTKLSHNLITLTAKEVRGCIVIPDDDIQDNIEGDAFVDHIMQMVTKKIANELDEAYWIGDTKDIGGFVNTDIRSLFDGWRYRILNETNDVSGSATILNAANSVTGSATETSSSHLVDSATTFTAAMVGYYVHNTTDNTFAIITAFGSVHDVTLSSDIMANNETYEICQFKLAGKIAEQDSAAPYNWEFKFGKARRVLPSIYKKEGLANLRYFTNDQVEQDYFDALTARNTNLGDLAITGKVPSGKIPIVSCPLMPNTLDDDGVLDGGSYTDCMLTHKDNLIVGIYKEIEMETERQAADRATYFYYTLRADLAVENVNAIVIIKNLITG